jgi:methylase of polypeptide subunit release factors
LEIGSGAGVTLTEVLLSKAALKGFGTDINPEAVENTKANLHKNGL